MYYAAMLIYFIYHNNRKVLCHVVRSQSHFLLFACRSLLSIGREKKNQISNCHNIVSFLVLFKILFFFFLCFLFLYLKFFSVFVCVCVLTFLLRLFRKRPHSFIDMQNGNRENISKGKSDESTSRDQTLVSDRHDNNGVKPH